MKEALQKLCLHTNSFHEMKSEKMTTSSHLATGIEELREKWNAGITKTRRGRQNTQYSIVSRIIGQASSTVPDFNGASTVQTKTESNHQLKYSHTTSNANGNVMNNQNFILLNNLIKKLKNAFT